MQGGPDRARRFPAGPPDRADRGPVDPVDELLSRHGLLGHRTPPTPPGQTGPQAFRPAPVPPGPVPPRGREPAPATPPSGGPRARTRPAAPPPARPVTEPRRRPPSDRRGATDPGLRAPVPPNEPPQRGRAAQPAQRSGPRSPNGGRTDDARRADRRPRDAGPPTPPPRRRSGEPAAAETDRDRTDRDRTDRDRTDRDRRRRAARIDESLTRLTAAHAGVAAPRTGRDEDDRPRSRNAEREADERDRPGDEPDDDGAAGDGTPPPPRRVTAPLRVAQAAVAVLAVLVVATAGVGWVGKLRLDAAVREVAPPEPEAGSVVDADAQLGDENLLLLTTDPAGTTGTRADTVVLTHLPADGSRVVAIALPWNLEINRPPCERWDPVAAAYVDRTVPAETRTTLDTAYAVGGPRCAARVVEQVTGLAVTRVTALDLAGAGAIVDAVGGVQVCLERPVVDAVLGPVAPAAGPVAVDAARALGLVRARDVRGDDATGLGLVRRQQEVFAAALGAALSTRTLMTPGELVLPLGTAVVTEGTGVDQLLALTRTLARPDADRVSLVAAPTGPSAGGRGTAVLRDADAAALFRAVRAGAPLPPQAPADPGPAPEEVSVDVLNGAGRTGVAAEVGRTLADLGFDVGQVGSAEAADETVVRFSPDRAAAADLVARTVPAAVLRPDPEAGGVLQLVLGRSFDGTVRAPAEPVDEPAAGATADCA